MNRIFVTKQNEVIRAASEEDAAKYVQQELRELTKQEIKAFGIEGFEQYVSPLTATVLENCDIIFNPPEESNVIVLEPPIIISSDTITYSDADFLYKASVSGNEVASWLLNKFEL